jgi:hypothetical protein
MFDKILYFGGVWVIAYQIVKALDPKIKSDLAKDAIGTVFHIGLIVYFIVLFVLN